MQWTVDEAILVVVEVVVAVKAVVVVLKAVVVLGAVVVIEAVVFWFVKITKIEEKRKRGRGRPN